jgi:hypothetical protein
MTKEFVPYEQALDLKELGFDEPCFGFYNDMENNKPMGGNFPCDGRNSAPLYQQAFDWIREKHYICGWVQESYFLGRNLYQYTISRVETLNIIGDITEIYEKAKLECLKKLIEIVKNK